MVSSYLSEFNNSIDCTNNILSIPSGLRGVIYQKIIERDNIDIEVIVDNYIMTEPMNELSIKSYCNLVESFGIMFDNAIEASECVNNPYIYIYLNEDEKSYIIKCCNKINNDINIDELLEKGRTSKTNHQGVGLYYINKKTNFNLKICIHSDKFSTMIVVRK